MGHSIHYVKNDIKFKNVHGNYFEPFFGYAYLYNKNNKDDLEGYKDATKSLHEVIKEVVLEKNLRIRGCGSLWSLSKAPYVKGMHLISRTEDEKPSMRFHEFLADEHLETNAEEKEYLFCQSGCTIKYLNSICLNQGRSLQTSGASNGQTIAGAIGTGVHGSTINVGSIQDTVYGLHIITGPNKEDAIYLEAQSNPVANSRFAERLECQLVRDDDLFNAALVGLGSFGYVHGVMVQTETVFTLHNTIKKVDLSDVYRFMKTMSVANSPMASKDFRARDLFHMKFYINQYRVKDNIRAEIMYKEIGLLRTEQPSFIKYNKDFTITLGKNLSVIFPFLIPWQMNKRMPGEDEFEKDILGKIFWDTKNLRDGQFSCAIAVDIADGEKTVELLLELAKNHKKIPSLFSLRYVKKSKATLAFTKFDMNCLLGIDGIETQATREFIIKAGQELITRKIPHAWHWGKANFMNRNFVIAAYGKKRDAWITAREKIFKDQKIAQAFTSEYVAQLGLIK